MEQTKEKSAAQLLASKLGTPSDLLDEGAHMRVSTALECLAELESKLSDQSKVISELQAENFNNILKLNEAENQLSEQYQDTKLLEQKNTQLLSLLSIMKDRLDWYCSNSHADYDKKLLAKVEQELK